MGLPQSPAHLVPSVKSTEPDRKAFVCVSVCIDGLFLHDFLEKMFL